jgi:hypothetical protein
MPVETRTIAIVRVSLIVAAVASPAAAQERAAAARGESRTVVACVALESDYVRPNAAAAGSASAATTTTGLVLTDVASGRPLLNVSGLREAELARHVGSRVEITGTVEPPRTTPVVATAEGNVTGSVASERPPAAGVTPDGAAAHEPSDALAASVATRRVAEPDGVADPSYLLGLLPGLRAATFRPVDGACVSAAAAAARVRAQATPAVQPPGASVPRPPQLAQNTGVERVTARGCLVRQTAGGTALTPQQGSADALVLADATLLSARTSDARGAVPGSGPTDADSGTLPRAAATTGQAPVDAATTSFQLVLSEAQRSELAPRVGERLEVVGELEKVSEARGDARVAPPQPGPGRVQVAPVEVAHVSTPTRRLTISSFRLVGGTCQ